jgi:hypothetical protein
MRLQERAEEAAMAHFSETAPYIRIIDTAQFTPVKTMEGYRDGRRVSLQYKLQYTTLVRDTLKDENGNAGPTVSKTVTVWMDSTFRVQHIDVPETMENIYDLVNNH